MKKTLRAKALELIQKLTCKHDWHNSGWSYLRCKKCDAVRYDPEKAGEIISNQCMRMVKAGHWDRAQVNRELTKHGLTIDD